MPREHGGSVMFRQERAGRDGQPFYILKFRTLTDERDVDGHLLPDEARSTRFGRILRRTGLDELPQLWNVLRGEMSLVGPRPLFMRYLPHYSAEQARRHEVQPGVTGWAQVNGRGCIEWAEQFKLDVWYVDNRSLLLDAKIIWRTLLILLQGRGAPSDAARPEFKGDAEQARTSGADVHSRNGLRGRKF